MKEESKQSKGGKARKNKLSKKRLSEIARMGAKARNEAMSDEERSIRAAHAAHVRWSKRK